MSRGARPGALLVLGTVLLTAGGCGGGAPGPSKTAYVQRVDRACTRPRIRSAIGAGLHELADLPRGRYARTRALRAAGRSLADPIQGLTAQVGGLTPPDGDQPVVSRWLDELHKLAVLTGQAAATERRIIALNTHHPGVVARSGPVRNADLDRAQAARLAAARTAGAYGLKACARVLAQR